MTTPYYAIRLQQVTPYFASRNASEHRSIAVTSFPATSLWPKKYIGHFRSSPHHSGAYSYIQVSANRPPSARYEFLRLQLQHNHATVRVSSAAATGRPLMTHITLHTSAVTQFPDGSHTSDPANQTPRCR